MKIIYLPLTSHNVGAMHEFMHEHKILKIDGFDYYIDSTEYPFSGEIRLGLEPVIYTKKDE